MLPLGDPRSQLKDPASLLSKRSVYYDFDRYDVKEDYRALVEAHAKFMLDNKTAKMRIEGNCDERGSTEYNLALGQRRADGVKRALMVLGVPADRIEAVSYGEEKPKATGQDEDSYAENRRSDMIVSGSRMSAGRRACVRRMKRHLLAIVALAVAAGGAGAQTPAPPETRAGRRHRARIAHCSTC